MTAPGVEHGDRTAFLARLRSRLAAGIPENLAHPAPPAPDEIPIARSSRLDRDDLVGSFVANAIAVRALVHRVEGAVVPADLAADIVRRHRVTRAVRGREAALDDLVMRLVEIGVHVEPLSVDAAAAADLGITTATAAIATTGTVVQESAVHGGRTASLLPPVHVCVVPASVIVATSSDVLRGLGAPGRLPSNLALVTGPSRSGDIEQIISLGVHGPLAVELVVLDGA